MKSDIDRLMFERELDALLVIGDSDGNSVMNYLTGGGHLEGALIVKKRNEAAVLYHGSMERDTAAETGLQLIDRGVAHNRYQLIQEHDGDHLAADQAYMIRVLQEQQVSGRIGIYGQYDAGEAWALLNGLQTQAPQSGLDIELVGEYDDSLFTIAQETKDSDELAELQEAGRLTCLVVGEVQAFIQKHKTQEEKVIQEDGSPLTIGHVKRFMRERLFFYGLDDHNATIFSQGRDAGVPHNRGNEEMPLRLGQAIIFDIFPQRESGYYHDMTRTWCLGYAPPEVESAWEQTKEVFDRAMEMFKVGMPCRDLQLMTCDYYEKLGHPTVLNKPGIQEGYVHSLGHGIGLNIHEDPRLTHAKNYDNKLQPGHVITVEPGLYYPDKGFGVRIEDAVALDENGDLIWLTDYPYDLVIPMNG
ncbi:MAG: Xaa-Pro peptidase family protein [Chloroflexota bacterium]